MSDDPHREPTPAEYAECRRALEECRGREGDPEFVAWLEGLTPRQREGLSFSLEGEGESLRMTFHAPRINYSGESRTARP